MEYIGCALCGGDDTKTLFKKKDKFAVGLDEFSVVECRKCGLLYVNPRPTLEEIGMFYTKTYSWRETLEADSLFAKWMRKLEKGYRYHLLKNEVSKVIEYTGKNSGKVLDIGCGTGDRLDVFRFRGFDVFGVETSEAADYGKKYLNLNIIKGDLFSTDFPENFFDLVTMYNVLEHTHHPIEVCKEINRILKDDGFLIVQIPNKDSLQCRIFKKRWSAFDVPRDLFYFGVKTISSVLKKTGFQIKRIDQFMNWLHPPTLVNSLFPTLEPQKAWSKEGKGQSTFFQRMSWVLLTLIAGPLTQLESILGRGAILTYYAIKEEKG